MKKIETRYKLTNNVILVQNEEYTPHINLVEYGENCSGILKYWGTKEEIINELQEIINKLKIDEGKVCQDYNTLKKQSVNNVIREIEKLKANEHKSREENNLPSMDLVKMYNFALDKIINKLKTKYV